MLVDSIFAVDNHSRTDFKFSLLEVVRRRRVLYRHRSDDGTGVSVDGSTEKYLRPCNARLDGQLDAMRIRHCTVKHVFGTLKHWMGLTHFQTRRLGNVPNETSLHVLAYNIKQIIGILEFVDSMRAMKLTRA